MADTYSLVDLEGEYLFEEMEEREGGGYICGTQ